MHGGSGQKETRNVIDDPSRTTDGSSLYHLNAILKLGQMMRPGHSKCVVGEQGMQGLVPIWPLSLPSIHQSSVPSLQSLDYCFIQANDPWIVSGCQTSIKSQG